MSYLLRIFRYAVWGIFLCASSAFSGEIYIIISSDIIPYTSCVEGIKIPLGDYSLELVNIKEDVAKGEELLSKIIKESPQGIIAVGPQAAFVLSTGQADTPRIFCMVLNPERLLGQQKLYPGVSLNIPSSLQIAKIKEAFPARKKIGVFFTPASNQELVNDLAAEAAGQGLQICAFPVASAQDIPAVINTQEFAVDLLLVVPDESLKSTKIVEYLVKQCLLRKIPVVGYNSWFAKNGALLSFIIDYRKTGIQTGQLASQILQQGYSGGSGIVPPDHIDISVDLKTARKLGIEVSETIIKDASEVIQ